LILSQGRLKYCHENQGEHCGDQRTSRLATSLLNVARAVDI
jgi:hypothetical protein